MMADDEEHQHRLYQDTLEGAGATVFIQQWIKGHLLSSATPQLDRFENVGKKADQISLKVLNQSCCCWIVHAAVAMRRYRVPQFKCVRALVGKKVVDVQVVYFSVPVFVGPKYSVKKKHDVHVLMNLLALSTWLSGELTDTRLEVLGAFGLSWFSRVCSESG